MNIDTFILQLDEKT
jgi:hypothetical protein